MDNAGNTLRSRSTARVVANPDVWLEGEAVRQLETVARERDCVVAVGMPDLHPGPGIPIGAAFGFSRTVRPQLVGSDAGCGALIVGLGKVKLTSSLERRVRSEFDGPPVHEQVEAMCQVAWEHGPSGLSRFALPEVVDAIGNFIGEDGLGRSGTLLGAGFGAALGTIGGGNHFAEIAKVAEVADVAAADKLGLGKGSLVVLCHSGSRGLGKALSDKWGHQAIAHEHAADYLAELAGAVRFARTNRVLLAWRLLKSLGVTRASKLAFAFDCVHNSVTREACGDHSLWVHRKGCAPAHSGQLAAVLGSRGTPSWIVRGRGNVTGLFSVAHGAGRKMQRSEARDKLRARYRRKQLHKSSLGGMVICDDSRLLYEEHPDAYKEIAPVIDSLVQAKLADCVLSLEPLITVKK